MQFTINHGFFKWPLSLNSSMMQTKTVTRTRTLTTKCDKNWTKVWQSVTKMGQKCDKSVTKIGQKWQKEWQNGTKRDKRVTKGDKNSDKWLLYSDIQWQTLTQQWHTAIITLFQLYLNIKNHKWSSRTKVVFISIIQVY